MERCGIFFNWYPSAKGEILRLYLNRSICPYFYIGSTGVFNERGVENNKLPVELLFIAVMSITDHDSHSCNIFANSSFAIIVIRFKGIISTVVVHHRASFQITMYRI